MDDLKKALKKNFLKKYNRNLIDHQQTLIDCIENYSPELEKKVKETFNKIVDGLNIEKLKKDSENIKYRQILAPVFRNKFFLVTDLAPVDSCFYQTIVEILFKKVEQKHVENTLIHDDLYKFKFESKNHFFNEIINLHSKYNTSICLFLNISDFYPRIYHHRLENILKKNFEKDSFECQLVKVLMNILKSTSKKQSYGIPIGPKCSNDLAEILLYSFDENILNTCKRLSDGDFKYYRHSDTFFILFNKIEYAREVCAEITNIFIKNNNFNFQSSKSEIISLYEFLKTLEIKRNVKNQINNSLQSSSSNSDEFDDLSISNILANIKKLDSYQFLDICEQLSIQSDTFLIKLYKLFSQHQIHILDIWFRKARDFLKKKKSSVLLNFIANININELNYDFYKIMRDQLIIDFGDEIQFKAIQVTEEIASFYYPNYMLKRYEIFPEYEVFFSQRHNYNDWNTWKQIGYLLLIPFFTRNKNENEFFFCDFTIDKNTKPFFFFKGKNNNSN
ncbi:DNA polymerase [Brachionus plicatilis]|uniref:DNA polymerase n=1 Tax=Brachionus plicatilis TaxID=10195 RepID=A0A3M7Q9V3_BRAPC|nr:DNA polymerase [Brachionus plicatilis]